MRFATEAEGELAFRRDDYLCVLKAKPGAVERERETERERERETERERERDRERETEVVVLNDDVDGLNVLTPLLYHSRC